MQGEGELKQRGNEISDKQERGGNKGTRKEKERTGNEESLGEETRRMRSQRKFEAVVTFIRNDAQF